MSGGGCVGLPGFPCWGWPRRSVCVPLRSSADQDGSDPGGYLASSLSLSPCQSLVRVTQPEPRGGEVGLFWPERRPISKYDGQTFRSTKLFSSYDAKACILFSIEK